MNIIAPDIYSDIDFFNTENSIHLTYDKEL